MYNPTKIYTITFRGTLLEERRFEKSLRQCASKNIDIFQWAKIIANKKIRKVLYETTALPPASKNW